MADREHTLILGVVERELIFHRLHMSMEERACLLSMEKVLRRNQAEDMLPKLEGAEYLLKSDVIMYVVLDEAVNVGYRDGRI